MGQYRVFELNPVTNEWRDKGFREGSGQEDTLRKAEAEGVVTPNGTYVCTPEKSYHPVTLAKVEVVRYAWQYGEPTANGDEEEAEA